MQATEVFTPRGEPNVTYVGDHLIDKAKRLRQDLSAGPCVVSLSGPSKSGKTVFIEKTLGRGNLVKVHGAGVRSAQDLWLKVLDLIGTPTKSVETIEKSSSSTRQGKVRLGISLIAGEASDLSASGSRQTQASERATDYFALLVREIHKTNLIVFIDDFHYIDRAAQNEIAKQIKEGIEGGVQFVCVSVPYRSDDVLLANSDLRGRAYKVDFEYWKTSDLVKIGQSGFSALNLSISPQMIDALASEAAGSPQLMQTLCLNLCFELDCTVRFTNPESIAWDRNMFKKVCVDAIASLDYSSTVDAMKLGPKTRGRDRKSYTVKGTSEVVDVYPLILRAIAYDPPTLTMRSNDITSRIQQLCASESPGTSSILPSCSHIVQIANESQSSQVIEWDPERDLLEIRDPYLLFFLRWGRWK